METELLSEKSQKYSCNNCDYFTYNKYDFKKHQSTQKHINCDKSNNLEINGNLNLSNEIVKYNCQKCNYNCSIKHNFNLHLLSKKHIRNINKEEEKIKTYCCNNCNKEFTNNSGLWKHKQKCVIIETENPIQEKTATLIKEEENIKVELPSPISSDVIMEFIKNSKEIQTFLLEQNKELQKTLVELSKNQSIVNSNNTTNNTTNNQFNLNFFLNETCKDAMNITDFINSLQLTTKDFENTGKVGFIEGISQIIINKLNSFDTSKRPMHCTDSKRETLYIKDDNVWNKEDDKKTKFKTVVKQIASKNLQQLNRWKEEHPDCIILDTENNIAFRKYFKAALGGTSIEEEEKFFEKIKRNVLKQVLVDKNV